MAQAYGLNRDDLQFDWQKSSTTATAFDSYQANSKVYFTTHGSLDSSLLAKGALTQVPLAGGALVVAYNIGVRANIGSQTQLTLDGPTLAKVWSGDITSWSDPAIANLNPYLASNYLLPNATIVMAYTDDVHGSLSSVFLRYLCRFHSNPSTCLADGFGGLATSYEVESSTERSHFVNSTLNSLTYLGLAEATGMNVAAMKRNGTQVQPTTTSITSAMTDSTTPFNNGSVLDVLTATSSGSWPMAYLVYGTFFSASNSSTVCLYLNEYLLWVSWMLLNDYAASYATASLHPILPYDYKRAVLGSLSSVTCMGKEVSSTAYLVGMGSSNPLPTLGRYYPASKFVLKYFIGNTDASLTSLIQGTIDFGQTSAPVSAARLQQAPDIMTVPAFCWGIVPSYNLPELIDQPIAGLRMNWSLVSDIYLGQVVMWNDPKIADLNPEVADLLPNRTIKIVYQINRSTVSLVFNTAISSVVPQYNVTIGPVNNFDNSSSAQSSRGIPVNGFGFPEALEGNQYSFGLCTSMDLKGQVRGIYLPNPAGNWVTASAPSVLSAIQDYSSNLDLITFYHAPGPQSYPITLLTAVTLRSRSMTDCSKAAVLVDWLYWMQTSEEGQDILGSSNYVPAYPFPGFLNILRQKLVNVTCRGVTVSSLVGCVNSDGGLCSGRGGCNQGKCLCQSGWTGDLCQEVASSSDSSSTGQTLGIVLGVTLPVALLLCLGALAVVIVLLVLRRGNNGHSKDYFIDVTELEVGAQLGQGGFGEVYKATWKGTEVAVKLMPEGAASSKEARENFAGEVAIMSTLRHPNVVLFMAACTKPPTLCIVMEFMALGSLYDLVHNELVPDIPLALKLRMAHQAAKGMHFLHASDIVHRDLKSLNLLLDNKWNVKVADFGLTKFRDAVKNKQGGEVMVGSVPWMAPEVLQEEAGIDHRLADIFSFGVIMWELLTREQPYQGMAPPQVAVLVITNDLRPSVPAEAHLSEGERVFARLMAKCWQRDAPMRPDFIEIMQTLVEIGQAHGGVSSGMFGTTNTTSSGSSSSAHTSSMQFGSSAITATAMSRVNRSTGGGSSTGNGSGHSSTSSGDSLVGVSSAVPRLKSVARRDVSFVVCDLAEFDRVWQTSPSEADRAIELYGHIVRRRCADHAGHVFSLPSLHSGGTFMLSFADPVAALRFALAVRSDVVARNNARLNDSWRISLDHRPGTCLALPEDHTRTGYEQRDYADACKLNVRCPLGAVVGSASFAHRLRQVTNVSVDTVARLVKQADGSCRVLDANDEDVDDQVSGEEDGSGAGEGDEDDDVGGTGGLSKRSGEGAGICSSNACHWIINTDRIKAGEAIGEGNYGKVAQGSYFGTKVAIKRLFNGRLDDDGMRRMRKEAAILSNLDHPNIVKLIGLSIADGNLLLVMELVPRGSLRSVLSTSTNGSLPWNKRLSMLRDAALGVEFLHSHGIIHRDIKSSNLLVDDNWGVKVGDFGFATAKQDNATMTRCGTPCWTAPEILCPEQPADASGQPPTKATYTEAADVYSFGIVMWEVLTRKTPYAEGNMMTVVSDVLAGKRPKLPSDCPQAFAALVKKCWHRKSSKRPSMNEVLVQLNAELDALPL